MSPLFRGAQSLSLFLTLATLASANAFSDGDTVSDRTGSQTPSNINKLQSKAHPGSNFESVRVRAHTIPATQELATTGLTPTRNVLLIIADDLGTEMLKEYGSSSDLETPTINRLAEAGVLFTNAWSNPTCSPTRAGIYTGRHAFRHGIGCPIHNPDQAATGLPTEEITIAEAPNAAPPWFSMFGKWHLGYSSGEIPNDQGWSEHRGTYEGSLSPSYFEWNKIENGSDPVLVTEYATDVTWEDTASWVADQGSSRWMTTVAFHAPHYPYHVPPDGCGYTPPEEFSGDETIQQFKAMMECLDQRIGELLSTLTLPVLEQTTLIFVGDNGATYEVSEVYKEGHDKNTVYEGGVHVPLIIADGYVLVNGSANPSPGGPGKIADPGRQEEALVHTVDLFSTTARILGSDASTGVDSISLLPYLRNPYAPALRGTNFTEGFSDTSYSGAIRDTRYKLLYLDPDGDGGCYEIYDLLEDPLEENNLSDALDGDAYLTTLELIDAARDLLEEERPDAFPEWEDSLACGGEGE